jgi:hypothetical protein
MSAVLYVARAEFHRRRRSAVFLVLLVGFVGAAVLTTAAGARRTRSSLARFNAESHSSSVQVVFTNVTHEQLARFKASRDVATAAQFRVYALMLPVAPNATVVAPIDQTYESVDRPRLLRGRIPDPNTTDEIAIDESFASGSRIGLGDYLDALAYTPTQVATLAGGAPEAGNPAGPKLRFHVVGIVRRPVDLGRSAGVTIPIFLTPAFDHRYAGTIGTWGNALLVQTTHGEADVPTVTREAQQMFGASPGFTDSSLANQNNGAQGAIDVLAVALWICTAVAALAGVTVIAIVLGREIDQNGLDHATLQSLGFTRRERVLTYAPFMLAVGVGGAAVAVLGALAFSPLFPIGIARRAEPHLGISVDWTVLAFGAVGLLGVVFVVAGVSAFRAARWVPTRDAPNANRLAEAVRKTSMAPTFTSGFAMALQRGRGRATVPVVSAIVGATLGILGVSGALLYRANLEHLVTTPRLYGWTWDFKANDTVSNDTSCTKQDFGLLRVPGVGALEAVCYGTANITVDGRATNGWGLVPVRGTIASEMIAGRAPATSDEVALGSTTLRALHKKIGDLVTAKGAHGGGTYRIVGETVFPELGQVQPLADGASFTGAGYAPLFDQNNFYRYLVGRFAAGADRAAVLARARAVPQLNAVETASVPVEVNRLQQTNWTPIGIALLVGGLALIALAHALVTAVRRRRRDLAVFKTIGF